jgi:hypothetical protein
VRFWDASALVPLYVEEPATAALRQLFADDPVVYVWWATPVECASGLARLHREGVFEADAYERGLKALALAASAWRSIAPSDALRADAVRIVRVHQLRAADALQLAAARAWSEHHPTGCGFVSLDQRLRRSARSEGFTLVPE